MKRAILFCVLAFAWALQAHAEEKYPNQTIRILSPFGADAASSEVLRLLVGELEPRLKVPLVVLNQVSGKGVVQGKMLQAAAPDGYTLGILAVTHAASQAMSSAPPYDVRVDFEPISRLAQFANIVVTGESRIRTLRDFFEAASNSPGKLNVGTMQVGTPSHVVAHLIEKQSKLSFGIVPYRTSGDVVVGALRGDAQIAIQPYSAFRGAVQSGTLRPVAVTTAKRASYMPEVPTLEELGILNVDIKSWIGLYAPKGLAKEKVELLNKAIHAALKEPIFALRARELGFDVVPSTPQELADAMAREVALQVEFAKRAGTATP